MRRREATNGVPRSAPEATLRARTLPIVRHNAREERAAVRARDGIHSMGWRLYARMDSSTLWRQTGSELIAKGLGAILGSLLGLTQA